MPKSNTRHRYKINNWSEYNKALIKRGSLTIWVEEEAVNNWLMPPQNKKPGRPEKYSEAAIRMLLILREVYHLPLRAVQGMASSIFCMMGLSLPVPCYTQICRRAQRLTVDLKKLTRKGPLTVVFDSTGLKVYGEGEWKVRSHGAGKRRTWKKMHLGLNPETQEIISYELTDRDGGDAATAERMLRKLDDKITQVIGDGAYDSKALRKIVHELGADLISPPPKNASYKSASKGWQRKRDADIATIQALGGDSTAKMLWKKLVRYHRRSLVETLMYRLKQILGEKLKSRCSANQAIEAHCKCVILNKMTHLGLPKGSWLEVAA